MSAVVERWVVTAVVRSSYGERRAVDLENPGFSTEDVRSALRGLGFGDTWILQFVGWRREEASWQDDIGTVIAGARVAVKLGDRRRAIELVEKALKMLKGEL